MTTTYLNAIAAVTAKRADDLARGQSRLPDTVGSCGPIPGVTVLGTKREADDGYSVLRGSCTPSG